MWLIIRFGSSLKCLPGRVHPYYYMAKVFGDVIPNKIQYLEFDSIQPRMFHHSVRNWQQIVSTFHTVKRFRYSKKEEESSDSEDEVETVEDVGKDFKILKLKVNSLRADLILKSALGMARNKVEAAFYESKIRVNGAVLMKKSSQVKVEDEVDLVRGSSKLNPRFLLVSRVKILSYSQNDEKYIVNAQCFRSMTIDNYSDRPWKASE